MINEKEFSILNLLLEKCPDGVFKILDAEEILNDLNDVEVSKSELLEIVTSLGGREAINVKLSSIDEYCLTALPKAKVFIDEYEYQKTIKENMQGVQSPTSKEVNKPIFEPDFTSVESKKGKKRTKTIIKEQPMQIIKQEVDINFKRIFWTAFTGAFCGGGFVGLILMIIILLK